MNVEVVFLWQLALAVGQVGEAAAEVKEERVGVDPGLSAKIELDTVTRPEVDQLRKTGQPGEFDQVFTREIRRQGGRRELVDVYGSIRGAYDADPVQISGLQAGFYDTIRRHSVTEG
jgi:hypothetical protein